MAKGGYKGSSPARETSPEEYSGVWDIVEQYDEQTAGSWPFQKDDNAPKCLTLDSASSAYIGKTFTVDGDRRVWTWSCWFKKHKNGANQQIFGQYRNTTPHAENRLQVYFNTNDQLQIHTYSLDHLKTNRVFRDNSAWTHLVLTLETTNSVANNRLRLYINGIEETSFATRNNPSLNQQLGINTDGEFNIGTAPNAKSSYYSDVSLSEVQFIDGQPLSCEEFGFFDGQGIWQPKRFTGDYSSGPVYSNSAVISSGGSASSHPLHQGFNGNLSNRFEGDTTDAYVEIPYEATVSSGSVEVYAAVTGSQPVVVTLFNGSSQVASGSSGASGSQWHAPTTYAGPITKIRIARTGRAPEFNAVRVNGTVLADATVGRNSFHLEFSDGAKDQSGLGNDWALNGIQITETESIFSQIKYTGTNSSNPITGTGFTPDFVWIKRLSSTNAAHSVYSSSRGVTKSFDFDNNTQEKTNDPQSFVSFDSDGFTVSGSHNQLNSNGSQFAAFSWKAGGASTTTHSASTTAEGSIASTYTAGDYFSIVTYSGTGNAGTIKHGLNKKPKWVVVTPINADDRRRVYHEHMDPTAPHDYYANLDLDQARTSGTAWNGAFTDKVITLGTDSNTNSSNRDYIAWVWAEQPGKSKFGVYDGSSSAVTIDVGFAPDWVIIKCVGTNGAGQEWIVKSKLYDDDEWLQAEQPYDLQSSGRNITWTSTGFTVAPANGPTNYSGRTLYIYSAFKTTATDGDDHVDSPVNGNEAGTGGGVRRGNYCTLNPLDSPGCTLTNGNRNISCGSSKNGRGTVWPSSGKWYFEFDITTYGNPYVGIGSHGGNGHYVSENSVAINNTGTIYVSTNAAQTYPGKSVRLNAIGSYMCAFDLDNGKIWWGKDGTWYRATAADANMTTTLSQVEAGNGAVDFSDHPNFGKEWTVQFGTSSNTSAYAFNAGQRAFKYPSSVPAGFSPLATSFLPEPTIKRGDEVMDVTAYTGNQSGQTIQGLRFSPDLLFIKSLSNPSSGHFWHWHDTVRGKSGGFYKALYSNTTEEENKYPGSSYGGVSDITANGFTLTPSANYSPAHMNANSVNYAAYSFNAGDATTTISAGGSNDLAYNRTQTWSGNISTTGNSDTFHSSYPATNAFNNNDANYAHGNADGSATAVVTLTLSPGVSCSNTVTFLGGMTGSGTATISVNGGTAVSLTSGSSATTKTNVSFSGTVTSIVITKTSSDASGMLIYGFEIDGTRLVDNGVSVTNVPEVECKVRANQAAGFSIIKVDSPTNTEGRVHGLSKTPDMIICKSTASADSWHTYWKLLGKDYYINLNGSSAKSSSDQFGSQEANSVSFFVKPNTGSGANKAGGMVYYAWHSVEGYSRFGEYTANNSASGPFQYCGFRPKVVLIWCHNQGEGRNLYDTERQPGNFNGYYLKLGNDNAAPTSNTESFAIDILSNGFKPRGQWGGINDSNTTAKYLFAAWAEDPFASQSRAR